MRSCRAKGSLPASRRCISGESAPPKRLPPSAICELVAASSKREPITFAVLDSMLRPMAASASFSTAFSTGSVATITPNVVLAEPARFVAVTVTVAVPSMPEATVSSDPATDATATFVSEEEAE